MTHGGYLATQKDLVAQLRELNKVIEERARSLNSLLSLKGKLDMLEAQMALRRAMRSQRDVDEDEEDEAVIYVEDSDSEDLPSSASSPKNGASAKRRPNGVRRESVSSSVSEDLPNGLSAEGAEYDSASDEEESDSGSEVGNGLVDDEAEETDADEDSVEHESADEVDEDEESDDGGPVGGRPPAKMQRMSGMFSRVR